MDDGLKRLEALKKSYLTAFNGESGKKVLKDLERRCFNKTTTFSKDALTLAFREGQRSVYLSIKGMMEYDIEKIKKLIEEQEGD